LLEVLQQGGRIAVVSDAGTPGIADPGALLAREAIDAGIVVFPIPGANAAISALVASGLSAERFAFHGFLPSKEGARRTFLEGIRDDQVPRGFSLGSHGHVGNTRGFSPGPATHIFYEAPHRIVATLEDVVLTFGAAHRVALARELTKLHEEFLRGTAGEVLAALHSRPSIRGEMVLLLDGTPTLALRPAGESANTTLGAEVAALLKSGLSEKDALKQAAKSRGLSKSEAYREWQRTQPRKR